MSSFFTHVILTNSHVRKTKTKAEVEGNQSDIDLTFKDVWRL